MPNEISSTKTATQIIDGLQRNEKIPFQVKLDKPTFEALREGLIKLAKGDPATAALVVNRLQQTNNIDYSEVLFYGNQGNGYAALIEGKGKDGESSVRSILQEAEQQGQIRPGDVPSQAPRVR